MENKNVLKGTGKQRKSENIKYIPIKEEEKIEVEFRITRRIYARDFLAIKTSFEEWASSWN
jgi:hypothetical protein